MLAIVAVRQTDELRFTSLILDAAKVQLQQLLASCRQGCSLPLLLLWQAYCFALLYEGCLAAGQEVAPHAVSLYSARSGGSGLIRLFSMMLLHLPCLHCCHTSELHEQLAAAAHLYLSVSEQLLQLLFFEFGLHWVFSELTVGWCGMF